VIITQGEAADSAFFVRQGLVKLVANLPGGRERIVRLLGRGAWIGLGGLLNPVTEHAAIAVGPVETYRLSLTRLRRLKQTHPALYCRLTETWYDCLQDADLWLTQFCCGPVRARVARLVNFLASMHGIEHSSEVELLTCDEMAGILAVTPESVSRTLAQFKRSGILCAEHNRSHVVRYRRDALALQALANH
jgi:CRP/FNR family transcriptional regulator